MLINQAGRPGRGSPTICHPVHWQGENPLESKRLARKQMFFSVTVLVFRSARPDKREGQYKLSEVMIDIFAKLQDALDAKESPEQLRLLVRYALNHLDPGDSKIEHEILLVRCALAALEAGLANLLRVTNATTIGSILVANHIDDLNSLWNWNYS